ncbi:MAG: peptide ABC transporter substrate-binding protein [Anaerolineales bacterium]|nr:peptide ABC transporter substrate-binding protein [Anaerolineales bacterium]
MNLIKKLRWQILIIVLALIVIAVVLWGQQAEPVLVEAPEPTSGGIYKEGVVGSLIRLNPLLAVFNPPDQDPTRLLFSGLIHFGSTGLPQPDLSSSWGISRNGEVYNLSLRTDALWHDGEPVTSDDVVFTVSLLKNSEFPVQEDLAAFWQEVEVEALDEHTLQFRLPEAFAPFLDYLDFGILPVHLLGDLSAQEIVDSPFNLQPVGSGPFQFDRLLVMDNQITGVALKKNPDYYGDTVFFDQVEFIYFPDSLSAWEAYRAGDILGIGEITLEILKEALEDQSINLYTSRMPQMSLILMNLDNPEVVFFQEVEMRRALLQGINRQYLVDHINQGQAIIADGPIFPKTWAYYEGLSRYDYDREAAIKKIRNLGYTYPAEGGAARTNEEGDRLAFTMIYPEDEKHTLIAQSIQENWAVLGIDVSLQALPYEELISDRLENRSFEVALVDLNLTSMPDPDPYPFWHQTQTTGGQNYSIWNDRQASEYLEQARIILDFAERQRLYKNFQVRFFDQLPALPLYYPVYTYGVSSDVKGVRIGPTFEPADRLDTISDWYFFVEVPGGLEPTEEGSTGG